MTIARGTPCGRISELVMDGALRSIPGMETGQVGSDQALGMVVISSGFIDLTKLATVQAPITMPYNAIIIACSLNVNVQPSTGPATVTVGKVGDADYYLNDYFIGTSHATGITELIADAAMLVTDIAAGEIVCFGTDGGGSSNGDAYITLVVVPR